MLKSFDNESKARYLYGACKAYCKYNKLPMRLDWSKKLKEQCGINCVAQFTEKMCNSQSTTEQSATEQSAYKDQANAFAQASSKKFLKGNNSQREEDNPQKEKAAFKKTPIQTVFNRYTASPVEDSILAYAKIYSWKQSENYHKVSSKIGYIEPPFKKPENIDDINGYNYVNQWKNSAEGQQWLAEKQRKGYLQKIVNPYPNPNTKQKNFSEIDKQDKNKLTTEEFSAVLDDAFAQE